MNGIAWKAEVITVVAEDRVPSACTASPADCENSCAPNGFGIDASPDRPTYPPDGRFVKFTVPVEQMNPSQYAVPDTIDAPFTTLALTVLFAVATDPV